MRAWLAIAFLLAGLSQTPAAEPELTLKRAAQASGGGVSTNAASGLRVTGTIGQSGAARMSGGSYAVRGGALGGVVLVQVDGAPVLRMVNRTPQPVLAWRVRQSENWVLETASSFAAGAIQWQTHQTPPTIAGTEKRQDVSASQGIRFFRLRRE